MRRVRFTTAAFSFFVSIAVAQALPASASDDDLNRCTQAKVAMHPVRSNRPADWGRAIRVSGPARDCEPSAGLAARSGGR